MKNSLCWSDFKCVHFSSWGKYLETSGKGRKPSKQFKFSFKLFPIFAYLIVTFLYLINIILAPTTPHCIFLQLSSWEYSGSSKKSMCVPEALDTTFWKYLGGGSVWGWEQSASEWKYETFLENQLYLKLGFWQQNHVFFLKEKKCIMIYISISQDKVIWNKLGTSDCLSLFFYDEPNLIFSLHSVLSLGTFHERHG